MSDYTPTTEQARRYWQYGANAWRDGVARDDDEGPDGSIGAEFDRWLTQVCAEAWERGYKSGHSRAMRRMSDEPDVAPGVNPYREDGAA